MTCTATFTKRITLTLKGTPENPEEVTEQIVLIPGKVYVLPNRSGSDFYLKGWSPAPCAEIITVPESDLTCTASFGRSYKLTVKGSPENPEEILYSQSDFRPGSSRVLPDRSGPDYYIKRWSPAPCAQEFIMPESDLTCTAEYGRYYTLSVDHVAEDIDKNVVVYNRLVPLEENEYTVWEKGDGKYGAGTLVSAEASGYVHDYEDAGLELVEWDPPMCSAPFPMPEADVTCTAYFRKTYRATILAYKGEIGEDYVEDSFIAGYYMPRESVSLNITPSKGGHIAYVYPEYCLSDSFAMPTEHLVCRVELSTALVVDYCFSSGDERGEICHYRPSKKEKYVQLKISELFDFDPSVNERRRRKNERSDEDEYVMVGESVFMTSQSNENGIAEIEFRRPVNAVAVNISDYSGDTELMAYDENGAVVKSIPVRGETLQEYIIGDAGGIIKKIVISSSDAYVDRNVEYAVDGFIGDINFDDSPDLTDAILALQVLSGIQHFGGIEFSGSDEFSGDTEHFATLYPAMSVNGKISLADAIFCLQSSAGLR
jgi:hypothetical protein